MLTLQAAAVGLARALAVPALEVRPRTQHWQAEAAAPAAFNEGVTAEPLIEDRLIAKRRLSVVEHHAPAALLAHHD